MWFEIQISVMDEISIRRESDNWLIHILFIRKDYKECLELIEEQLRNCNGISEYPIFVKGKNYNCYYLCLNSINLSSTRKN